MNNKIITYILSILLIVSLTLGFIGYLNKDNIVVKPTEISSNIETITYTNGIRDITSLEKKIENYDFVKANKEFSSNFIKVSIQDEKIIVEIQKSGITNATETLPEIITYTISDISSPQGVQAQMDKSEDNKLKVYTIDAFGRLFVSTFNANPVTHNGIKTQKFGIDNIESFTTLTIPLDDTNNTQIYSIFKTSNNEYYTDYLFEETESIIITKINNVEPIVEEKTEE